MKVNKKLLILILYCFSNNLFSQSKSYTDAHLNELKGNVKSCVQSHYIALDKFGVISNGMKTSTNSYYYNQCGYEIEKNYLFGNLGSDSKVIHKYIDNCKKKKERTLYDKNGNVLGKEIYNYNNLEIEHITYDKWGKTSSSSIIKMDSKGNDIYYKFTHPEFGISEQFRTFDIRGNLIEVEEIEERYKIHHFTYLKYDLNNNLISRLKKGGEDTYIYDNKNNEIEYKYNNQTRELKKYDNNNNVVELILLRGYDKEIRTFEYTYDSRKNWIKKISYANGIVSDIIERVIEYY